MNASPTRYASFLYTIVAHTAPLQYSHSPSPLAATMQASPFVLSDIRIVRASTAVVDTEIELGLCDGDPLDHGSWWRMSLELVEDVLLHSDAEQRHTLGIDGELWRYDTGERVSISAVLRAAVADMTDRSQGLQPTFIVGTRREVEELRRRPLRDLADLRHGETVILTSHSPTAQSPASETGLPPREHTIPISLKHERTPTPDPFQPDSPAQPDPLPKLEQIDSASAETIVVKKERDSSSLKEDPDPSFIDDSKVTIDTGRYLLKVEKSEEDD